MGTKSLGLKYPLTYDKPLKCVFLLPPILLTVLIYLWASSIHLPSFIHTYFSNTNEETTLICSNDKLQCLSTLQLSIYATHTNVPSIMPGTLTMPKTNNTMETSLDASTPLARPFMNVLETNISSHNDVVSSSDNSSKTTLNEEQIAAEKVETLMVDLRRSASHYAPSYLMKTGIGTRRSPSCENKWVFMYNLPSKFNIELLSQCNKLIPWQNMCDYLSNHGMGKVINPKNGNQNIKIDTSASISESTSQQAIIPVGQWYKTHQYALEVIFHERLKNYPCITTNASLANLFYIPYYGGLDVLRWHFASNVTNEKRDKLPFEFIEWLQEQESWKKHNGVDHVIVLGKISWDFRRSSSGGWGNSLLVQKEMQNITKLLIERNPWHENDVGVPHPTFFHPRFDKDIRLWQAHINSAKRRHLVSFAGLPRPQQAESIRSQLIKQCKDSMPSSSSSLSSACYFMSCHRDVCIQPNTTMDLFVHSEFCLQPPGDSPTRRSIFDSLIGGCIPVLFDPHSAYYQYPWHLPTDRTQYSVYFPAKDIRQGKINVIEELAKIPRRVREEMRLRIIYEIMPGLVYAKPASSLRGVEDAFLISMRSLLSRVSDKLGYHGKSSI